MSTATIAISFARGAPSLDIIDIDGLREAAARAFANDPGGMTAYGTAIGYVPLRRWVAELADADDVTLTKGDRPAGYPEPIVDHSAERSEALRRYQSMN